MPHDPLKFVTTHVGRWGTGTGTVNDAADVDNNFWNHEERLQATEAFVASPSVPYVTGVTTTATTFSLTMSNSSVLGPYPLPKPRWNYRGDWAATTTYYESDVFKEGGSVYMVLVNHVSASSFNPSATDGTGHPLYGLMVPVIAVALDDLTDVTITSATTGQLLHFNGSLWVNVDKNTVFGVSDLTDVALSSPTADDVLTWDGSQWINQPVTPPPSVLDDLTDVVISSVSTGQVLTWNGTDWVNETPTASAARYSTVTALGNSGTVTLDPTLGDVFTTSPSADVTIAPSSYPAGAHITIIITTVNSSGYKVMFSGTEDYLGDIVLPKQSGIVVTISFIGTGSRFSEVARTAARQVNTLGTSGTVAVSPTFSEFFTVTPSSDITFTASHAAPGKRVAIKITTSGTSSFNITFGTNFISQGVLATGTVSGKIYIVEFVGDGTNLCEVARTTAM